MSREINVTPILSGCILLYAMCGTIPSIWISGWVTFVFIYSLRLLAIYNHL